MNDKMSWTLLQSSVSHKAAETGFIIAAREGITQAGTDLIWLIIEEYIEKYTHYIAKMHAALMSCLLTWE